MKTEIAERAVKHTQDFHVKVIAEEDWKQFQLRYVQEYRNLYRYFKRETLKRKYPNKF